MNINDLVEKIQFLLDENGNLTEMLKSNACPIEFPIKYKLKNAFEVFVRVKDTENYWISNYGRCVNNLNRKDKNTFYEHKQGNVHYTIYEIIRCPVIHKRKPTGEIRIERYKRDTSPDMLVAGAFLKRYGGGRYKIWHKDGDCSNNWYKNLIYVTGDNYKKLRAGTITWDSLGYEQEYMEYVNKASLEAYKIYDGIKTRCNIKEGDILNIRKCYFGASMCQEWIDNPKTFVKWYLEHYYEVEGESMAVDKDLFGNGSKIYSPEHCCILPQGLNTLLTNCKKHYAEESKDSILPLGVRYSGRTGKYYGEITFTGSERTIKLSDWDTKEEAFAEYKVMKQADILMVAAQYKDKIPDYIYDALLKVKVEPY